MGRLFIWLALMLIGAIGFLGLIGPNAALGVCWLIGWSLVYWLIMWTTERR